MDSGINLNYQLQQQQPNSGLSRFNSAPSSFLANLMDSGVDDRGGLVSSFMTSGVGGSSGSTANFQEFESKSGVGHGNSRQSCSGLPPHYPRQSSAMDSSYELFMDPNTPVKSVNPSLVRQTSSPAGFFSKLSAQNGFATTKEMGTFSGMNGGLHGVASPPASRLKSQLSFSSRLPSTLNILPQISEIESNEITTSPTATKLGNGNVDSPLYNNGFSYGSWNDPYQFNIMKTEEDYETKLFPGTQNGDRGNSGHTLSHHLSLPAKTSVEKYLQFQDTVPCKIRAKRGCATHPRSIAERVRRTRISERMRKLQELVPNMDKQTNTADMLDLAVDYIKDLQKQYKTLNKNRATCKCTNIQSAVSN